MKKLLLIALLGSVYGTVINVPSDYTTIQEGIDAAIDTDTVLVAQGAYYENLLIEKNITLTSNAIYDDLSLWAEFSVTFGQYELLNENIEHTVINGSLDTNGDDLQSVIYINSPDECVEPVIFGFTITGGDGTKIQIGVDDNGSPVYERRGGGFYSNNALPEIHYNYIHDNNGTELSPIHSGGGTDIDLNERCEGDIDLSYNFYRDNDAYYGNTLATNGYAGSIDMSNSIFDVYNCPEEEVTPVWVDVEEEVEVDFQYSAGDLCSITEDVWVSPDGDDYLNTGTSASNAFLTIEVALQLIAPSEDNIITINLTEGAFSPSTTGESFPIIMISNVNLIGQGEEVTIIDAEQTDQVVVMEECYNNIISDLTITGGNTSSPGGGIYLDYSNPTLNNITISGNTTESFLNGGGGMYLVYSNPALNNVTISDNISESYWGGGGMYLSGSSPILDNVTVSGNASNSCGGGMYLSGSSPTLDNVTVSSNTVNPYPGNIDPYDEGGGGMYLDYSYPTLNNVTISDNTVTLFENDINSTSDGGGGIYLKNSDPTLENVIISGNTTYGSGGGMYLRNGSHPILNNVTISDNMPSRNGGGIYLNSEGGVQSEVISENVNISGNTAENGGGLYVSGSETTLGDITISGNTATYSGGGMYLYHSAPTLENIIISDNISTYNGGGIYINSVYPSD